MLELDTNPRLIQQLKALVLYLSDSQKAYKECARVIRIEGLAAALIHEANLRITMLRTVQTQLDRLSQQFSLLHGFVLTRPIRRLYFNLKELICSGDKSTLLNEIKRGDSTLANTYKGVLRESLPPLLGKTLHTQLVHFINTIRDLEKLSY